MGAGDVSIGRPIFDVGCSPPAQARVLILTAGYGEGHNAAARAIAAACEDLRGPGSARIVDLFALASPRLNAVVRRGYLRAINSAPRLWSRAYSWMDHSNLLPHTLAFLRRDLRLLSQVIASEQPTAICSTYPVYAFLIERLRRRGMVEAPNFNVVTDSISINSLWWRAGCAGWFVPNEDTAGILRKAGLDPRRLHTLGFPVTLYFSKHAAEFRPPDLAAGAAPRVLQIINSGTRMATATAGALFERQDWDVTCAVGQDEGLRRRLEKMAAGRRRPAQILGWTDLIPRLLMTHHIVVSKAGGATTQEAIAARCPMIVSQVVPGQEEGNYELLRRHGIGALAETPEAVMRELTRAFADRGAVWNNWRLGLAPLSRPEAALEIASYLLHLPAAAGPARVAACE
ncbi:MAG: galactosyldiacylglycerol synthase [Opitutaceae bacterium]